MHLNKGLVIFVLSLVFVSSQCFAIDWHEQKKIAKDIGRHLNYRGSFAFDYYEDRVFNNASLYGFYEWKDYRSMITFYKPSLDLDRQQFKCLVYHELGHYNDRVINHADVLSENVANSFMLKQNSICDDWKNTRYIGYE